MADEQTPENSPIKSEKNPTGKASGKKRNLIKKAKNPTENKSIKQGKIKQSDLVKWTIFVQEETKTFCGKAIEKAGVTIMEWVDSRLQQAARDELTSKPKPPAKPEDVADLMTQLEKRLKDQQAETTKAQGDQIQKLTDALNNRPASLKEWLFGKPKND